MSNIIRYYTGIGSRETPKQILDMFERMGIWCANRGYCLRSGHAKGADQAFEAGCDKVFGNKEIYILWKGFEYSDSDLYIGNLYDQNIAKVIASTISLIGMELKKVLRNCKQEMYTKS